MQELVELNYLFFENILLSVKKSKKMFNEFFRIRQIDSNLGNLAKHVSKFL